MLEDIWDFIVEAFEYIISFEWLGDIGEFFSGLFENLGEFSITGLIFGVITFVFVFMLRDYMLIPFLNHMGRAEYLFWGGATYLGSFIGGYMIGKKLVDDD